jgi:hypothetical protein
VLLVFIKHIKRGQIEKEQGDRFEWHLLNANHLIGKQKGRSWSTVIVANTHQGAAHMNRRRQSIIHQQQKAQRHSSNTDAYAFFNLLTGPDLFDCADSLLPCHRERLFPPTETLSMFMAQALSADRSCQKAVNDMAVKQMLGGLRPGIIGDREFPSG